MIRHCIIATLLFFAVASDAEEADSCAMIRIAFSYNDCISQCFTDAFGFESVDINTCGTESKFVIGACNKDTTYDTETVVTCVKCIHDKCLPNFPDFVCQKKEQCFGQTTTECSTDTSTEISTSISTDYSTSTWTDYSTSISTDYSTSISTDYSTIISTDYSTDISTDYSTDISTDYSTSTSTDYSTSTSTDCLITEDFSFDEDSENDFLLNFFAEFDDDDIDSKVDEDSENDFFSDFDFFDDDDTIDTKGTDSKTDAKFTKTNQVNFDTQNIPSTSPDEDSNYDFLSNFFSDLAFLDDDDMIDTDSKGTDSKTDDIFTNTNEANFDTQNSPSTSPDEDSKYDFLSNFFSDLTFLDDDDMIDKDSKDSKTDAIFTNRNKANFDTQNILSNDAWKNIFSMPSNIAAVPTDMDTVPDLKRQHT